MDVKFSQNGASGVITLNRPDALNALNDSALFRTQFGDQFVDYFLHIKRAEVARFYSEVTNWEHQEYFEMY